MQILLKGSGFEPALNQVIHS